MDDLNQIFRQDQQIGRINNPFMFYKFTDLLYFRF